MDKSNLIPLNIKPKAKDQKFAQLAAGSDKASSVLASGAIATTLILVLALNIQLSRNETPGAAARLPASVIEDADGKLATDNLAKRLSEKWGRQPANFGKTTEIDKLSSGFLEGKYSVRAQSGKILELEFTNGKMDRPKYIPDKEEFLIRYKALIGPEFQKPVLLEEKVVKGELIARYQLIGPSASPVAEVTFVSDESDRLLSLKVQK